MWRMEVTVACGGAGSPGWGGAAAGAPACDPALAVALAASARPASAPAGRPSRRAWAVQAVTPGGTTAARV